MRIREPCALRLLPQCAEIILKLLLSRHLHRLRKSIADDHVTMRVRLLWQAAVNYRPAGDGAPEKPSGELGDVHAMETGEREPISVATSH